MMMHWVSKAMLLAVCGAGLALASNAQAQVSIAPGVLEYGDEDLSNTGVYSSDPKAGATLLGLATGATTTATNAFNHSYPFSPSPGDYAGTDQIYVGSVQTDNHDGYSNASERINGPQVITLDYSALLASGNVINSFTLGIGADDFQFPAFGQRFTASINGVVNTAVSDALNRLDQTGPYAQFISVGLDPASLTAGNVLTLSIDEGGDGGDGWAIDYLTVGVTGAPSAVPEPGMVSLVGAGGISLLGLIARRRRQGFRS